MMKKQLLTVVVCMVFTLSACLGNGNTNLEDFIDIESVEYNTIEFDWTPYQNAEEIIEDADLVVIGKVLEASFHVVDANTGLTPTQETEDYDYFLTTRFDIDVITVYKGETEKSIQVGKPGGIRDYHVEKQLGVIKETGVRFDSIPISEEFIEIEIEETYLFALGDASRGDLQLYGFLNPVQFLYKLDNPLGKKTVGNELLTSAEVYTRSADSTGAPLISVYDIISVFGEDKWDEFWTDWQRDNPDWDTWMDKAAVEKVLAES
ncbi:MAG: hypothetical protein FWG33_03100 [Oscillospiraceae bacterium]|nr:hypothetical protein [Oscillospiraceae bacterium]